MKPRLRQAGPQDLALLRELMLACWTGRVAADSSAFRETEDELREELALGGALILSLGPTPIASVRWRDFGEAWEMARLGVLPAFRKQGHSQTLCEAVVTRARAAGARELRIGIRRDQPRLIDFYAMQGFVLASDFSYSHPNPCTDPPWLMRLAL